MLKKIPRDNLNIEIEDIERKKLEEYLEEIKVKTDWLEGEDIIPKISNYVMHFFMNDIGFRLSDIPLYFPHSDYRPDEFAAATIRRKKAVCLIFANGKLVMSGAKSTEDIKYATFQFIQQLSSIPQLVRVLDSDKKTPLYVTSDDLEPLPGDIDNKVAFLNGDYNIETGGCFLPGKKYPVYAFSTLEKVMKFQDFSIVNVVGCGIASTKTIDLALISIILNTYCSSYDPESFPGLKFVIHQKYCPIRLKECIAHIFDSGNIVFMGAPCKEDVIYAFMFVKCIVRYFVDQKATFHKILSKFQYRTKQQLELNENIDDISSSNRHKIANKILEVSSIKCFGNYMYDFIDTDKMNIDSSKLENNFTTTNTPDNNTTSEPLYQKKIDLDKKIVEMEINELEKKRKQREINHYPVRFLHMTEDGNFEELDVINPNEQKDGKKDDIDLNANELLNINSTTPKLDQLNTNNISNTALEEYFTDLNFDDLF